MKTVIKLVVPVVVILLTAFHSNVSVQQSTPWVAPSSADTIQNPLKNNPAAVTEGKNSTINIAGHVMERAARAMAPAPKP